MVCQKMNGLMIAGVLGVLGMIAPTVVGCATPQIAEEKGATSSKLLAPNPLLKAKSSPASNAAFGITEWRLYRGKNDLLLTGYNAKGAAVKGVSVGFHTADSSSLLRARVMDGSLFAAKHDYGKSQTLTNQSMSDETSTFLSHALSDFRKLHAFTKAKASTAAAAAATNAKTQSLHSLTFDDGSGSGSGSGSGVVGVGVGVGSGGISSTCGVDMMAILNSALQCVQSASGSSGSSVSTGTDQSSQYQTCLDAAEAAASAGSSCAGASGDGGCFDATADGGDSCYDDDDDDDDSDGCSGSGGWGGSGPGSDWGNNPFGDGACPSCSGGASGFGSDISGDSGNGGCSFSDSGGGDGGGWGDGY